MNTLSATTTLLTHSLAWALLYSIWQGLLIYVTLSVVLKALPNLSARVKYYLSFGAFSAMFLWFADTWSSQYQRLNGMTVYITQAGGDTGASTTYAVKTSMTGQLQSPLIHSLLHSLEQYFSLIIFLYTIGLAFMLFRFMVNIWQVRVLRTQGLAEPQHQWNNFIAKWQRQFSISRPVQLFLSARVYVPTMLGTIKPIILLPIATINNLTTEQVEAILLHELAHIKRQDYLLNIIQTIIETILFFNPFVWLVSGTIRREREHCCDDLVVDSSANPLPYAKALAILESTRIHGNDLALAVTGHRNQLFNRIKRIMEMKKKNLNYSQLTIILVFLAAVTFSIAMFTFTPSFAQKAKSDKGDKSDKTEKSDTTQKNIYHYKTVTIDKNGKKTVVEKESSKPIEDDDADASDNNTSKNTKTQSYSYTYSSDDDDLGKAMKEVTIATKCVAQAMANVNMKEIEEELENAQKEINAVDWDKVRREISKGLEEVNKELNDPKLRKEIKEGVKKALEESKNALELAQRQLDNIPAVAPMPPMPPMPPMAAAAPMPPTMNYSESHSGNTNFESMLKKMENDGLIDRERKFSIEKDGDELYINGDKQPESVYEKYHKYFKDKSVSIKGKKGALTININN